jgi:hypothetical protein
MTSLGAMSVVTLLMGPQAQQLATHLSTPEEQPLTLDVRAELPSRQLQEIHPSWVAQEIGQLPTALRTAAYASLPSQVRSRTGARLAEKPATTQPASCITPLLLSYLWGRLRTSAYVPEYRLPDSPLRQLLTLTKAQLVQYIDLLSLWELAPELQQLIDRSHWDKVRSLLTPQQESYLDAALRMKGPVKPTRLLPLVDQPERFKRALHERGLMLLASAFGASEGAIVWHLSRRLDTGRGQYLEAAYSKQAGAAHNPKMIQALLAVMNQVLK